MNEINLSRVRPFGSLMYAGVASLALVLAATGCDSSTSDGVISIADSEQLVERRISGDSQFWAQAPFLFEGPFACPIPLEVLETNVPQAYETFVIHNNGETRSLEIRLEGSSFDSGLSAEPLLLVYPGSKMPQQQAEVATCLAIDKPGGGDAGTVTVTVGADESVLAIALELGIGPGLDGDASGTFRLRVVP